MPERPTGDGPADPAGADERRPRGRAPGRRHGAAAAAALRRIVAKYPSKTVYLPSKDGGESAWQKKVEAVEAGMTKTEVLKLLPTFTAAPESLKLASGDSHVVTYRLDYHWTVRVNYRNPDAVIDRPVLRKNALRVEVAPLKDFTGTWVIWHVNGQKGRETQYKNGKYDGVLTGYHDNGRKSYKQPMRTTSPTGPTRAGNRTGR